MLIRAAKFGLLFILVMMTVTSSYALKKAAIITEKNFEKLFKLTPEQQNSSIGDWCSYQKNSPTYLTAMTHLNADSFSKSLNNAQKNDTALFGQLYTADRIVKAQNIFQQVKELALQVLNEKIKALPPGNKYADTLFYHLSKSQLITTLPEIEHVPAMYQFNAETYPNENIIIGSLILIVDEQPEALFHVLAHEMGHIIGPTYLFNKSFNFNSAPLFLAYDSSYPFDQSLQCVSQYTAAPNYTCFEMRSNELSHFAAYQKLSKDILLVNAELHDNPYVSVLMFQAGKIGCQVGQYEEAQADFFGAEIMAHHFVNLSTVNATAALKNSLAFFCEQIWRENITPQTAISPYPAMTDRLMKLILKNADLRTVIGENPSAQLSCRF